jgi:hypothetical protein
MPLLSQQILQTLEILPDEDQQQVLSFAEFLWAKRQQVKQQSKVDTLKTTPLSFFEAAQALIGAGEGLGDVSTNPSYMQGYGQ